VEGISWTEDSSTGGLTARTLLKLDGSLTESLHPANKSVVKTITTVQGQHVNSLITYDLWGHKQDIQRSLEEDGQVYHVHNVLTLKDGTVYTAEVYYNRTVE
jgi:hypothetical protein